MDRIRFAARACKGQGEVKRADPKPNRYLTVAKNQNELKFRPKRNSTTNEQAVIESFAHETVTPTGSEVSMKKKVLIAIDNSLQASQTVGYASRLAANIPDMHYHLLHIQPAVSGYLLEEAERSAKARTELERLLRKNQSDSHELLEKFRDQMVRLGTPPERLSIQGRPRNSGVADDILELGHATPYDAVLVGRRGVSYLHELFTGSVTTNLVNHSKVTPIWIVDGEVTREAILLAVDGSPSSLRAVDHLAFVLSGDDRSRIQMVHVQPRLQEYCVIDTEVQSDPDTEAILLDADRRCISNFYGQAMAILAKAGIAEARTELKTVAGGMRTAKTILDEVQQGGYGTVVVGRSGASQSRFFGSVSAKVLQGAKDMAVWIVP
jgi:nucleotide-binding universal stress UspA family protein